ncbi:MAG: hypothetical protein FJW90_08405 [Actinobacteria bacterium]|nr:hypothetical protein [Actinomycetota bacterium]
MDGSIFYYLGGALVLAALVLSWIGIRGKGGFPASNRSMAAVLALFGLLVIATSAYAVANAQEEQEHREEELAEEQADAAQAEEGAEETEKPAGGEKPPPPPAEENTFELTSPEDGSLVFEPDSLQTTPGNLTIAYTNPSAVPHNVAVEDVEQQLLGGSETITESDVELQVELVPGEFVFFCTVPGHREAGMEGTITVE